MPPPHPRRSRRASLLAALCSGALLAGATITHAAPAAAQPSDAECSPNTGGTGGPSWTDHAELERELDRLARQRSDVLDVAEIGTSNQGRELWSVTVGSGPRTMLVVSEIHGNEKSGTEAILSLLRSMSGNSPQARELRDQVTLVAVPKMNPDGSELDRRGNDRTWDDVVADFPHLEGAEPAWNYYDDELQGHDYAQAPGFDVNRDFHPDLDYTPQAADFPGESAEPGWYIQPEAQAVRDLYQSLDAEQGGVDAFVDLHHQGPCYLDEDGENWVNMSLSADFVPDPSTPEGADYAEYADDFNFDLSRQLNVAAYDALDTYGNSPFGSTTLYPQGLDLPGTALGAFSLNGSGVVLFEIRGQTQSWGARQRGQLVTTVERGLQGMINQLADGSVTDIDPERYHDIPETMR
ncbi:M14 family metallopeptidase [Lipingzhangella sp. LS1_29]|uniref:M14 family metallopeptidase n=1 Tax=Lipingzhangella rawalii TaxID=2055835 RepID=A0ABU2H6T2_9ACTN|nr:M14 family metallopeptidase [Lipingzhangella rawalii]MDS1270334.1 M14 family metallopeptidase [Lipingzhangella rawalii]